MGVGLLPAFGGVTRRRFLQIGGAVALGAAVTGCRGGGGGKGSQKGRVTALPGKIARNFQRDVTAELTAWIAAQPDGTTIEVPAGARYRINGTVAIRGKKNLTLTCPTGVKPVFTGEAVEGIRERTQWYLDRCEDIRFHRIRTEGSNRSYVYNVDLEAQSAWWIAGCKRVELDQCEAEWTYGDFVQVQGGTIKDVGHPPAEDVWIHDCTSDHIGRIQLVTNSVRRLRFNRNRCRNQRRSFWDAEPNFLDQIVEHVYIEDNDIDDAHFEASGGKPTDVPVQYVVIRRNRFNPGPASLTFGLPRGTGTPFPRRQHIYWVDNVATAPTAFPTAIALKEANFCMVRGNKQPLGAGRKYLAAIRSCGLNIDVPVDGTREACNVTPVPSPAPASVPEIPAVWPFPR
jgi:hypothetical protein